MSRINLTGTTDPGIRIEEVGYGEPILAVVGDGPSIGATFTPALLDVIAERQRQQEQEGWTPEHDDKETLGALASAAACYALAAAFESTSTAVGLLSPEGIAEINAEPPDEWPFDPAWWKPKDARRDLVRAAALLLAEIERRDRAAAKAPEATP